MCHGDPTLGNLHLNAAGEAVFFDFDKCGPGWLAYDLKGVYSYARGLPRPEYWDAFAGGYQAHRPLSEAELRAMPYFVILNIYWCMGFEAGTVIHSRGEALINDGYFSSIIATLRAWEAGQLG